MLKKVNVRVPATSANCGPGFDSLGFACNLYNVFTFELIDAGFELEIKGEGAGLLKASSDNLAILAFMKVWKMKGFKETGLKVIMENNIPLSRGLGSSSTAIVAGLVAANAMTGDTFSKKDILNFATEIEGHPDNVAPAIFGNFTISYLSDLNSAKAVIIKPQKELKFVAIVPEAPLSTSLARSVLPKEVLYTDATFNVSRVAVLVATLMSGEYENLPSALEDHLHQKYRLPLIEGAEIVFSKAKELGAFNTVISGAGSTLMSYLPKEIDADAFGKKIIEQLDNKGHKANYFVIELDEKGACVVD